jgi:hypothetical protein
VQAFLIFGPQCRVDEFPGTILYYYEVKGDLYMWENINWIYVWTKIIFNQFFRSSVGLSGAIADNDNLWIGDFSNSYAIPILGPHCYACRLAGAQHLFELPEGAIRPKRKGLRNVYGCGLVLDPDNNLAIFFTLNGQLLGELVLGILRIKQQNISN